MSSAMANHLLQDIAYFAAGLPEIPFVQGRIDGAIIAGVRSARLQGKYSLAETINHKHIHVISGYKRPEALARAYDNKGRILADCGRFDDALEVYVSAENVLARVNPNSLGYRLRKASIDGNVAEALLFQSERISAGDRTTSNLRSAAGKLQSALEVYQELNCQESIAFTTTRLGVYNYMRGRLGEAEELFERAKGMQKGLQNPHGEAIAWKGYALTHCRNGNRESLSFAEEGIVLVQNISAARRTHLDLLLTAKHIAETFRQGKQREYRKRAENLARKMDISSFHFAAGIEPIHL